MLSSRSKQDTAIPYKGLVNQGATCYLNSVLQVLFMTPDFREALQRSYSGSLDCHLKELFDDLKEYDGLTYKITKELGITDSFVQADAAECFEKILRNLTNHEASQIFQGVLRVKNKCSKCNRETFDDNPCWSLPLELVDSKAEYRVEDGITQYFCPSEVSGPDQLFCGACDAKTDSTVKIELKQHPEVLTLLLKRFKFDYSSMRYFKVERSVKIPQILEIQSQTYEVYAFVEHNGYLKSGHYTATIKSQKDDEWYFFNDSSVHRYYKLYQLDNTETSRSAYLLFYRKLSAEEALNEANEKACVPESSETHGSETNKPHNCDEENVKSETNCKSCDSAERQGMKEKEEESLKCISEEKEHDFRDQTKIGFEKQKGEENKPEDQAQAPKRLTKYDLCKTSTQSSAEQGEDRVRFSERSQELDGENRRRSTLHKQQSDNESSESKITPGNQTGRGSIQSSVNTGMAEGPRTENREEPAHCRNVLASVKPYEGLNNESHGQSREELSNMSADHDAGSRKNPCIQQRDDGRDAGNKQKNNVQLPQTGGNTLTNDGCDDGSGSVQHSGGLYRSSVALSLHNQSSGKKMHNLPKRTQNEDIVCRVPKRKCNEETVDDQQHKHDDERASERDDRYVATLNHPARSSEDRKERTNRSNVEKTRESDSSCDRVDHLSEHSKKIVQRDAASGFASHRYLEQCSTEVTPVHTAPSNSDPVSHLTKFVHEMTLTDRQTPEDALTNTPVKTESRDQQMLSNTHGSGYSPESPNYGHFDLSQPYPQSYTAYSIPSFSWHMPVNTDSRGQERLLNPHCGYSHNLASQNPGSLYEINQNSQGTGAYSNPSYTALIDNIPIVFDSSVEPMHHISAPLEATGPQLAYGITTNTQFRSEITRRGTQAEFSNENTERGSYESQGQVITEDSADPGVIRGVCSCFSCKTRRF